MCADSETNSPFSSSVHPFNVDIVVDQILSYVDKEDFINYRLVCHKWNDIIVRKVNRTGRSFKILLRYEPHVPKVIDMSGGRRGAGEVLGTVISTLTGTAARLHFDTVIIDRDFYLAGVMPEFEKFLRIQGQSIRNLKIDIRRGKRPLPNENHVMDCAEVVSMDNLRVLFRATPNLKSLNFCVRFSNYDTNPMGTMGVVEKRCIYPFTQPPHLKKLTNLIVHEPEGFQYSVELLKKLMSLPSPSNLQSFYIKPTKQLTNFAHAINAMKAWVEDSLSTLYISSPRIDATYLLLEKGIMEFSYLPYLKSLTVDKISGCEKYNWIRSLLRAYKSTLVNLVLGQRKLNDGEGEAWNVDLEIEIDDDEESLFPPVMSNLEDLRINLTEFNVREHVSVESYKKQFPRLDTLLISGCPETEWTLDQLDHLLPGVRGRSRTLNNFFLFGDIEYEDEKIDIVREVSRTFPNAGTYVLVPVDDDDAH